MHAYYKEHSRKLIKDLDAFLKQAKPILLSMEVNNIEKVIADTRKKFIDYLEEFPFIGGDANTHTSNLVQAAWAAAIYEVLKPTGFTPYKAGELFIKTLERKFRFYPKFLIQFFAKKRFFNNKTTHKMIQLAKLSQEKKYAGDWVFTANANENSYEIVYTECGIEKFFRNKNIEELTPYLCNLDYYMFAFAGVSLRRTQTIGCGDHKCNFKISKEGSCPAYWPPQFMNDNDLK